MLDRCLISCVTLFLGCNRELGSREVLDFQFKFRKKMLQEVLDRRVMGKVIKNAADCIVARYDLFYNNIHSFNQILKTIV